MTTFHLKLLALVLMLIDHIGLFFPFTPIWFRWLGRLSAPLFIFCMVYGFSYTKNRKIYLIRMYLFGAGMGIVDFILNSFNKGDLVINNIFVTLFSIAIIIKLIDLIREHNTMWKIYLLIFLIWQILSLFICYFTSVNCNESFTYLIMGFMGNIFYNEGGFIFVLLGVILYYFKESKKITALFYSIFCILYSFITITDLVPRVMSRIQYYGFDTMYNVLSIIFPLLGSRTIGIYFDSILYVDFQWMMIGALPFMLLYNGKEGKKLKYFFYIFYPAHILILFIISMLLLK